MLIMKEKLGDNPDFQPMPRFVGGNSRLSRTDVRILWIDQPRLWGRNSVNQQKRWPLSSWWPKYLFAPGLEFLKELSNEYKRRETTVTPKVTSHSSLSHAKKRNSRKRVPSKENILCTQAACSWIPSSQQADSHLYRSLEPMNSNENIPGNQITGAGGSGEVEVAHIGHFLESRF